MLPQLSKEGWPYNVNIKLLDIERLDTPREGLVFEQDEDVKMVNALKKG